MICQKNHSKTNKENKMMILKENTPKKIRKNPFNPCHPRSKSELLMQLFPD